MSVPGIRALSRTCHPERSEGFFLPHRQGAGIPHCVRNDNGATVRPFAGRRRGA